jgi:bacteriocin biosynthesis cyclodehydratase domain-containing protein
MEQPHKNPIHLVCVGAFGKGVGEYFERLRGDTRKTILPKGRIPEHQDWANARAIVLAAWRPVPDLCEWLDDFCYERRIPWVPVMLELNVVRVGPLLIPGASCWDCWVKRSRQHTLWPEAVRNLLEHYASHPGEGPTGYLEPFAMIAATQINLLIEEMDSAVAVPGYIWQIDMMDRRITTSRVIAVHDCARCGLRRSRATRSYLEMRLELAHLWPEAHDVREKREKTE